MTASPAPSFEQRLAALRADWHSQLPARLLQLQDLLRACIAAPQDDAGLQELHRGVHSLAGTAGTFGLPDLSREARAIELRIEPLLDQPGRAPSDLAALQPGLDALHAHGGA